MKWVIKYTLGNVTNEFSCFSWDEVVKWIQENGKDYSLLQIVRNGVSDRKPD